MGKGSGFEREMCKKFSLWWTNGTRDDIFWRTAGSGARATTRFRKSGKSTYANSGDLLAVDPIGKPFTDIFTVEMKRGYKNWSIMDLVDKSKKAKEPTISLFLKQALMGANRPDCYNYPLLLTRRDQRTEMLTMPISIVNHIFTQDELEVMTCLYLKTPDQSLWFTNPHLSGSDSRTWVSISLSDFLSFMTPARLLQFHSDLVGMKSDYIQKFEADRQKAHDEAMKAVIAKPQPTNSEPSK